MVTAAQPFRGAYVPGGFSDPLKWWSEHTTVYGKMAHIARKYLGTPATTVPCEIHFSLAGHIVQKRRSSLSPENVNKLVCLTQYVYMQQEIRISDRIRHRSDF